jgi:hypothetical protein
MNSAEWKIVAGEIAGSKFRQTSMLNSQTQRLGSRSRVTLPKERLNV